MPYRPPFPIPEDIHATPFCLCIKVPNDPTWKRVVAGLLDELNQWYNWQRDEERSGKECAQVWRGLYAEIDWSTMSCCCDSTNPPQYQYSETGVLQISLDGGVTYTDAPNADVRNNSPKFPPVPGDDGNDKKCAAATGAANLLKEQVGDQLTDDMSRYTLEQLISDWTGTVIDTSNPFQALVTVVSNQIFALVIAALRAALTDDVYHLFACALYCKMGSDASFNDAQWAAARGKILADIGGIAGVFLEHLVFLLGKTGTTNLVRSAPDATGDCSDCDCGYCPVDWTFYGVHDVVHDPDDPNIWHMTANGNPEHVAFSSGDISTGCYFAGPLGTYSYWPVGSGSPVGGTNPAHTAIWNADFGGDLGGGAITMTFSSDPFP
jgi:hypothetical protein